MSITTIALTCNIEQFIRFSPDDTQIVAVSQDASIYFVVSLLYMYMCLTQHYY